MYLLLRPMTKKTTILLLIALLLGIYLLVGGSGRSAMQSVLSLSTDTPDCFSGNIEIQETDSPQHSSSQLWWVNSGARVIGTDSICATIQGSLPENDKWRLLYSKNNPLDTDDGYHPQNLLRLVRTVFYKNVYQELYFKIVNDNLSNSSNRNASNGVLFFMRYQNSDNLYYAGLRVDGTAVVKKKLAGKYTTLVQAKLYPGTYSRDTQPNLMPHGQWIGIRSEIVNQQDGGVLIRLYVDNDQSGRWQRVLWVTDQNNPILSGGYGGIRGDFMDLKFKSYIQRGYAL